ncbi:hypothetical protein SAMN05421858_0256 [Haladaptatus litoreus]|uniref:Zinc-ribbon domain-containing protein n=1 Tax=Haladaptatus litoreus TaxID=553468 RepID=A0A1N6V8L1_9EURY|nr:hypothetical protein SAMN05421858_0256 [Haladaptatus litoreus]
MGQKRISKCAGGRPEGETTATAFQTAVESHLCRIVSVLHMGERACYLEFCPACDAQVTMVDEECPDCGASLVEE